MELSIRPRCESGTSRAPGASGAAASPESPWRAVKIGSIQRDSFCPSDFSTYANVVLNIHYSFPLTATPERMHCILTVTPLNCLALRAFHFIFLFIFLKVRKSPQAFNLTAIFFFPAPTGRLDWWMKVSGDPVHKQLNVNLFWKVHKSRSLLGTCHKPMHFPFFFSPG